MSRTTYLDGLRGIAAAIVATDHYFMGGVLDAGFRSYWADPPEENRRLYQLPPFRLLFAAHAMVPLFLVISGFAISINLLRLRNSRSDQFLRKLSSAATRRVLRIYLPVFVITVASQVVYFCGLYQWDFGDAVVWGRTPWRAPWFHMEFVGRYMLDVMNIINFQSNGGLNGQLWTMTLEFRGSLVIYLVILALAFWRPRARLVAIGALAAYWFYYGIWDVFGFLAGLFLAELHVISESGAGGWKPELPNIRSYSGKGPSVDLAKIWTCACFIMGIWLVCLSDDGFLPPGYAWLDAIGSSRWDNEWDVLAKVWKTTGAVFLVYAIGRSDLLQRPLNSRPIQYLGKISFSLYLLHQSVYHLVRNPIRDALWFMVTGTAYPGMEAQLHGFPFAFSWIGSFVMISFMNLYAATLYTKYVDERCIDLAKRFDDWISV